MNTGVYLYSQYFSFKYIARYPHFPKIVITSTTSVSNVVITATNGTYTYKTTMNGTSATIVINRPGTYRLTTNNINYSIPNTATITNYNQIITLSMKYKIIIYKAGYKNPYITSFSDVDDYNHILWKETSSGLVVGNSMSSYYNQLFFKMVFTPNKIRLLNNHRLYVTSTVVNFPGMSNPYVDFTFQGSADDGRKIYWRSANSINLKKTGPGTYESEAITLPNYLSYIQLRSKESFIDTLYTPSGYRYSYTISEIWIE